MPKIDVKSAPAVTGTNYPKPFDEPCLARGNVRIGLAAGITQFGVNITTLPPGAWSSQRHWHALEDELVYVLEGEVVLIEDEGEQLLGPSDQPQHARRAATHDRLTQRRRPRRVPGHRHEVQPRPLLRPVTLHAQGRQRALETAQPV
jgi:hypothetical protein